MPNILLRFTIDAPPERAHQLASTRDPALVDGPPRRRRRQDRRAAVRVLPRPRRPRFNLRSRRTQPGTSRLALRRRPAGLDRHRCHLRSQTPRRRRDHADQSQPAAAAQPDSVPTARIELSRVLPIESSSACSMNGSLLPDAGGSSLTRDPVVLGLKPTRLAVEFPNARAAGVPPEARERHPGE
jgi:hypothetical protein